MEYIWNGELMIIWTVLGLIIILNTLLQVYTNKKLFLTISIFSLLFFSSFRYNTGIDYDSYVILYENILNNYRVEQVEISWKLLNKFSFYLFNNFQGIFIISSLIMFFLLHEVIKKEKYSFLIILLFFFGNYYWDSISYIRQYITVFLFLYSIRYIEERKFLKFLLINLVGFLFHKSAIVCIPFYFISKVRISKIKLILLVPIAFFLRDLISFVVNSSFYFKIYSDYFIGWDLEKGKGIGFLLRIILLLLIIILSEDLFRVKKNILKINHYIIGSILFITFYYSGPLRRISYFFLIQEIFIYSEVLRLKVGQSLIKAIIKYAYLCLYIFFVLLVFTQNIYLPSRNKQERSDINTYFELNFFNKER